MRRSKSDNLRFVTARPFASRTETGIGTSVDSTFITSSSSFLGVGDGVAVRGRSVVVTKTDLFGVGDGDGDSGGLTRPDCAATDDVKIKNRNKNFIYRKYLNADQTD